MTVVQPVLTDEQALLTHQALISFLNSPEGSLSEDATEEGALKKTLSELVFFFSEVVEHPEHFGLKSLQDNKRIIRAAQPVKGPAQPQSGRNKRKARQERRMGFHKRRRKENREFAESFNKARTLMETEQAEGQAAFEAAQQKMIDRFESLAKQDTLSSEEVQEIVELFGSPEGAARIRELRVADDPQARIDRAAEIADDPALD